MCLAIYRHQGAKDLISAADLQHSYDQGNNDGFGLMYVENGEVKTWKAVDKALFPEFQARVAEVQALDLSLGVHLRLATHGTKDVDNAHPYFIIPGELAIIHNGIISGYDRKHSLSDTAQFARSVATLGPVESWWETDFIWHLMADFVGAWSNKIVFLRNNGECKIIGMDNGHYRGDVWFSNKSYEAPKPKPVVALTTYQWKGDRRSGADSGKFPQWYRDEQRKKAREEREEAQRLAKQEKKQKRLATWEPPKGSQWRFNYAGTTVITCHECVKEAQVMLEVEAQWVDKRTSSYKQCDYCNQPLNTIGDKPTDPNDAPVKQLVH